MKKVTTKKEIERKFLVTVNDQQKLHRSAEIVEIEQTYLLKHKGVERRVRKYTSDNLRQFLYTEKTGSGLVRKEKETKITEDQFFDYLIEADPHRYTLNKLRYIFFYKKQFFELDVYEFDDTKAILEIELESENQKVQLPPFLTVIKEVTDDKHYKNYHLAKTLSFPD